MKKPTIFLVEETDNPIVERGTVQNASVNPENNTFFARLEGGHSLIAHWEGFTDEIRCAGFTDEFKAQEFCRKLPKKNTTATTEKK